MPRRKKLHNHIILVLYPDHIIIYFISYRFDILSIEDNF